MLSVNQRREQETKQGGEMPCTTSIKPLEGGTAGVIGVDGECDGGRKGGRHGRWEIMYQCYIAKIMRQGLTYLWPRGLAHKA